MAAISDPRDLGRRHEGDRFPESLGERLFVAFLIALPSALVIAATVGLVFGSLAGLVSFGVLVVAIAVGLTPFLGGSAPVVVPMPAPAPTEATPEPTEAALENGSRNGALAMCPACGTAFALRRSNQRYCSVDCRKLAAADRRRSRSDAHGPASR